MMLENSPIVSISLDLLANHEIAQKMNVSQRTIEIHLS